MTAAILFILTYIGIALGKVPGLALDRVGIALLGAIAMVISGVVSGESALRSIDMPTILLLYSLMIVSAQLRLGGFYTWAASGMVVFMARPRLFLLAIMLASALLSAVLANDIVCFAFTPVLAAALILGNLNPLPFLIGLAVSSNIGSAATIIGNPQNMLIGQVGRLDFAHFLLWCGPPSLVALIGAYLILLWIFRKSIYGMPPEADAGRAPSWPSLNAWQTRKGVFAVCILIALFFTPIPREVSAIVIAGLLMCSRKMKTREILGLVDWHLITLFCALFIVIEGIADSGWLDAAMETIREKGIDIRNLSMLTLISTVFSNLFSNVPATMLLVRFLDSSQTAEWYTLAVSSTFAGNLFILGSIANLIVIEQAAGFGIRISFRQHAMVGVPVTLMSLGVLILWIIL